MTTPPAPDDSPIPPFTVPVKFLDGSLAGQTIDCDNDTHHFSKRTTGEEWQRYSEAPDGTLRSFFKLRTPSRPNPPANESHL